MKKIILYIAESLDGYVATKDGSVVWLNEFNDIPNVDYGYGEFMKKIDTVVQGNTTYEQFKDKHIGKNSYVFSSDAETRSEDGIAFVSGSIKEFIDGLDENTHKNIWLVGGPNLLTGFFNEMQIDELIIFIMPVFLKEGIPLFANLKVAPLIALQDVKKYENGVIELHYKVKK